MYEIYVLVEKKPNIVLKAIGVLFAITGVFTILLAFLGEAVFLLAAILCFLGFYFFAKRDYEYEYSYFDGDVRFARIVNKSNRKQLPSYVMEDVQVIAPITDRSVQQYLQSSDVKKRDYSTGYSDARVFALVVKGEKGMELIKFEPDDRYLDEVRIKYRQKVIR